MRRLECLIFCLLLTNFAPNTIDMMQLTPVSPENSTALSFIEPVYIQSFPADERRDFCEVIRLLTDNKAFHIVLLLHDNCPVGFISYWLWEEFAYIEHFAIDNSLRGSGYGAQGLHALLKQLACPVVLEVEPPVDEWACRRIGFYQRLGFELCNRPYTQPPYSPEQQSVALLLMSHGAISLKQQFERVVEHLHSEVYGVKPGGAFTHK